MLTPHRLALALLALLIPTLALAAWSDDVAENNPVCTAPGDALWPVLVDDGAGGTFVAWRDTREGVALVYAQHLDAGGNRLWADGGVRACTYDSEQFYFDACSDGAGGLYLIWRDVDGTVVDIFAQHLDAVGNTLWNPSGQPVCTAAGDQTYPKLVSDGSGGFVAAWADYRDGTGDIYAQRLASDGVPQWGSQGVAVCAEAGTQYQISLVGDTLGGAVIAWSDSRTTPARIYTRRINSVGTPLWSDGGNIAVDDGGTQASPMLVRTSDGQYILMFTSDTGSYGPYQMWAQKFNAAGAVIWGAAGVTLGPADIDNYVGHDLVADTDGGAYATWTVYPGADAGVVAQHLSSAGARLWSTAALTVANGVGHQLQPQAVLDGVGGVFITWDDNSSGSGTGTLRAQRYDALGQELWGEDGRIVNLGSTLGCSVARADGHGGLIAAWSDSRTSGRTDIYAQRIDDTGYPGAPDPQLTAVADLPNDQGGKVTVAWTASSLDSMPWHAVTSYSVWGRPQDDNAPRGLPADAREDLSARLGLAPARLDLLLDTGWTFLQQVPATLAADYACLAVSFGDSSDAGIVWSEYRVLGHGDEPWLTWESEPMAGYSVDNLSPGAPLALVGERPQPDHVQLGWQASGHHDEDLALYRIYRGDTPGFALDPDHLLAEAATETFLDEDAAGDRYYRVTAVDVHGNEGLASEELAMTGAVGVPDLPGTLALHRPYPNPFNPCTTVAFDLPTAASVRLDVLTVAGARVATLHHGHLPAGRHAVTWQGLDDTGRTVAAGVYIVRMQSPGGVDTEKVILAK